MEYANVLFFRRYEKKQMKKDETDLEHMRSICLCSLGDFDPRVNSCSASRKRSTFDNETAEFEKSEISGFVQLRSGKRRTGWGL